MVKTLAQLALDAIVTHTEFHLLQVYHKTIFKRRLPMYYINYSLDYYNDYKYIGKIASLKCSLVKTMELMISDYIVDGFKSKGL